MKTIKTWAVKELPSSLVTAKGTLVSNGNHFLVCARCCGHVIPEDAQESLEALGHIECSPCRTMRVIEPSLPSEYVKGVRASLLKVYYSEHLGKFYSDAENTKVRPCACGRSINKKVMLVSFNITNDSSGKNGVAMCKFCLFEKYGSHKQAVAVQEVVVEVPPFEPEVQVVKKKRGKKAAV